MSIPPNCIVTENIRVVSMKKISLKQLNHGKTKRLFSKTPMFLR